MKNFSKFFFDQKKTFFCLNSSETSRKSIFENGIFLGGEGLEGSVNRQLGKSRVLKISFLDVSDYFKQKKNIFLHYKKIWTKKIFRFFFG